MKPYLLNWGEEIILWEQITNDQDMKDVQDWALLRILINNLHLRNMGMMEKKSDLKIAPTYEKERVRMQWIGFSMTQITRRS